MKIVIVGYGSIGKRHTQNLLSISDHKIFIVTRQKNPQLFDKKRCKKFSLLETSLLEKPEIGFITNVSNAHVKEATKLACEGCHLFIEKPLSTSIRGIKKLESTIKKNKLISMMGCNLRFHPCIKKIKELISTNEIGRILSVHAESGSYLPEWHPYEDYRQSYASRKDLGGGIVLTCIHEIDYLYWLFGAIQEVFSMNTKISELGIETDDLSAILLRFKNKIIAEIHLDYFQRPDFRSCKIIGTKGLIYWDSDSNSVTVYNAKNKKWVKKLKLKKYVKNDEYLAEINHFLKCVKNNKKTINDISQGIYTLKIALAAIKSAKTKRLIRI